MVYGVALFFALFNNLAIFIVLVAVYGLLVGRYGVAGTFRRQSVVGLVFGLFAVGCMYARIPVYEGVIVDQRNAIVALSGAFGGPLAAGVSALLAASYRVYLGGAGALAGAVGICLAAVAGIGLHRFGGRMDSPRRAAAGALITTIAILPGFLWVGDLRTGWALLQAMALPYGTAIFLGIFLVGLLLAHEEHRRKASETLRESEENYRQLFDAESDALFLIDNENGRILQANLAASDLYGYPHDELLAIRNSDLSGEPEDTARVTKNTAVVFDQVVTIPLRWHRKKDGTVFPVEISGRFFTHHGRSVHIAAVRDITERKRVEEALRESQARLSLALSSAHMGVWHWDIQDDRRHFDDQVCRLLGIDPETFSGTAAEFYAAVHPEDQQKLREALAQTVARGAPYAPEYRVVWPDGSLHHLTNRGALVRDDTGRPQRVNGVVWDITEAKQAEQARRILEAELRQTQKMEAIGTLAGGIAHDFNNILGAILGYTELTLAGDALSADARRNLQAVVTAANRATELVKQILMFSRKGEETRKPLQLRLVVEEASQLLRQALPTTINIRLNMDCPAASSLVLADATQMHQVVMNLGTNAYHAMREAGGELALRLESVRVDDATASRYPNLQEGNFALLTVRDTGAGMDPITLSRIFDPFFTTKGVGEGTGLGLSVVLGIIQNHGGAIGVESHLGVGTTFKVFLPLVHSEEGAATAVIETGQIGGERILVVDDEPALAEIVGKILESVGYGVAVVTSPGKALETFRSDPEAFSLLLTDQTMPGMTGDMLAREVMKLRPGFPVIICTGYSDLLDDAKARAMGIRALVMKPVGRAKLAETLRRALAESQ
ncbi:MAG: PAS domain S-box protein [Deferrisomatales bacterium]|nr:PAS domain S-box protein [Deferrisomatales bacterium]